MKKKNYLLFIFHMAACQEGCCTAGHLCQQITEFRPSHGLYFLKSPSSAYAPFADQTHLQELALIHFWAQPLLITHRKVFTSRHASCSNPLCARFVAYQKSCPPNMLHEIEPKREQGGPERPYWILPSTLASSTRMISLSRMAGEVWRTLYTVLSRVLQASLWNTIITLVVGKGGHRLKVCSMHLQQEGKRGTKIWLSFTVPEWHSHLVIRSLHTPLWGVHFSCDRACVAAFEISAISERESTS